MTIVVIAWYFHYYLITFYLYSHNFNLSKRKVIKFGSKFLNYNYKFTFTSSVKPKKSVFVNMLTVNILAANNLVILFLKAKLQIRKDSTQ